MQEEPGFVFVTYTEAPGTASKRTSTRDLVRRQASKAHAANGGNDLTEQRGLASSAVVGRSYSKHVGRFRLNTTPKTLAKGDGEPRRTREVSALGPFVSSLGTQAWELLDYFRHSFRMKSMSIHDNRDWFALAMYNTSIAQATLCVVSLNRDLDRGIAVSSATLRHRAAAVRLLRREVDPGYSADKTLAAGAVAILAIAEDLEGNRTNSSAHLGGMLRLVAACNGLAAFSENRALLQLIAWADIYHAATWRCAPTLHTRLGESPECGSSSLWPKSPCTKLADPGFRQELADILCPDMCALLDTLHDLPVCPLTDSCPAEGRRRASRALYSAERMVMYRRHQIAREAVARPLAKTVGCAAALYILVMLRQMPLRSHSVLLITNDAMAELESGALEVVAGEGREAWNVVVLWVQVVTLLSLQDHDGHEKLGASVRKTMSVMGLDYKDDVAQQLSEISWSGGIAQELLEQSGLFERDGNTPV